MSPAKLRLYALFSACLLAAGCAHIPNWKIPTLGEARVFGEGLDSFRSNGNPKTLQSLPPGEWRERANYILQLDKAGRQNSALLKQKTQEIDLLKLEREGLNQEIKKLETTLNQLKEVLIDTELQSK